MNGTADRTTWPDEAVKLAESELLPDDALFYGSIVWPNPSAYADAIELPPQPRGERSWRWCAVKVVTGPGRGDRLWLFAMRWPERAGVIKSGGTAHRDVLIPRADPMERTA